MQKALSIACLAAILIAGPAFAETDATLTAKFLTSFPADALLVSNIHEQPVYDPSESKIGKIEDLVIDRDGKLVAAIISVGGFLGMGEKDVAVPFNSLAATQRDKKWWLTLNTTKDALKGAATVHYDKVKGIWTVK